MKSDAASSGRKREFLLKQSEAQSAGHVTGVLVKVTGRDVLVSRAYNKMMS